MKLIRKYFYWAVLTLVFGAIFLLGFLKSGDLPRFYVTSDFHTEIISTYNAKDGNYYVFLPAYADLSDISVEVPYFQPVTLNGAALKNGMDCSIFQLETPYELHYKRTTATLWFYKSAGVATMYINTRSGNVDRFQNDKEYEESALVSLYTADGRTDCTQCYSTLKGRGNATWGLDKRPYNLMLTEDADLLGMGSAKNWVLLANAYDETNLNNKLVLDMAQKLDFGWSPQCEFVDVYLNGQYNGLYLLTEKVEIAPNRLELDTAAGDFLCTPDLFVRWDTLKNPFETEAGRTMEITLPKALTQPQRERIHSLISMLEQRIFSGEDLQAAVDFDLDSWVRRYLIDEIFGNIDSDLASSFIAYSGGAFHAGPIWDYDMVLGNNTRNQNPHAFIARNGRKSDADASPYYEALYRNPSFYSRMTALYQEEFLPLLEQLLSGGIDQLAREIHTAAKINSLRWGHMYARHRADQLAPVETVRDVAAYLRKRVDFLNQAWLEGKEFCTLQFEVMQDWPYWNISVEKGAYLQTDLIDFAQTSWIHADTGIPFDPKQPITEDCVLTMAAASVQEPDAIPQWEDDEGIPAVYYVCLLSGVALFGLFAALVGLDIWHRRKERRRGHGRTKASP